jgi:hypothetical protein
VKHSLQNGAMFHPPSEKSSPKGATSTKKCATSSPKGARASPKGVMSSKNPNYLQKKWDDLHQVCKGTPQIPPKDKGSIQFISMQSTSFKVGMK